MEEIKQEWINEAFELEKAKAYKCCESCGNNFSNANTYFHYGFEAGFDCRDKLDNEALKIAVEALEFYGATANWTSLSTRIEYDVFIEENDLKHIVIGEDEQGVIVVKMAGSKARETLAEIRKLRPES